MSARLDLLEVTRNAIRKMEGGGIPRLRKHTAPPDAETPTFDALVVEFAARQYVGEHDAARYAGDAA